MNRITEAARLQRRLDTIARVDAKAIAVENARHTKRLSEIANKTEELRNEAKGTVSVEVLTVLRQVAQMAADGPVTDTGTDSDEAAGS